MASTKKAWLVRAAVGLALAGTAGVLVFAALLSSWSDVRTATTPEAELTFAETVAAAGGEPAYVHIDGGTVHVRRELEGDERRPLRVLGVLARQPDEERLVRIEFPYWFVRMKFNDTFNLGTLTAVLTGDWGHIDLSITEEDLELRGPGLILDETRADGARLVVWTE